ncbi:hypothetical protein MTR_8g017260 [Medicago truncatula]|uniref:Uncharacterized protein n=1 Tax=Medicago truncatula TaxID=3880 RepID=G7LHH4_MEDTR|nr:hypothetical protein MTR_8g017260 [Medicago truncatula]
MEIILTNHRHLQVQDVPRRPQAFTNIQSQTKISQVPNKPKDLTTTRGVRSAVWFDFKHNNHPNRERKKHAVWFGSVDF